MQINGESESSFFDVQTGKLVKACRHVRVQRSAGSSFDISTTGSDAQERLWTGPQLVGLHIISAMSEQYPIETLRFNRLERVASIYS